jgi:hypothetical protein
MPIIAALSKPMAKSVPAKSPAKGLIAKAALSPESKGMLCVKSVAAVATIIKKVKKFIYIAKKYRSFA